MKTRTTILPLIVILTLGFFALSPTAQRPAVVPGPDQECGQTTLGRSCYNFSAGVD